MNEPIYLDNNATTKIAPEVIDAMKPFLDEFWGNPSSPYNHGNQVKRAIDKARIQVASLIGAEDPNEILKLRNVVRVRFHKSTRVITCIERCTVHFGLFPVWLQIQTL